MKLTRQKSELYQFKNTPYVKGAAAPELKTPYPTKSVKFEIKEIDEDEGTFTGYAAVFGNRDAYGDIIEPGAFEKTLKEDADRIKILWNHNPDQPIGTPIELREDDIGLWVKGKIVGTEKGKEVLKLMREGVIDELSIGYRAMEKYWDEGSRYLTEIKLFEFSPVTFAANHLATVTGVKNYMKFYRTKAVVQFQDLPLASEERSWEGDAAKKRLKKWASSDGSGDKDKIDFGDFKKGFLYFDEDKEDNITAYKFPIADVIDGELKAVPAGIETAAAVLQGAMGGTDIPEDDQDSMKNHLEKYYEKMRNEFEDDEVVAPWNKARLDAIEKSCYEIIGVETTISQKEGRVLSARNRKLVKQAIEALQSLLEAVENDEDSDGKGDNEPEAEKKEKLDSILSEITELNQNLTEGDDE